MKQLQAYWQRSLKEKLFFVLLLLKTTASVLSQRAAQRPIRTGFVVLFAAGFVGTAVILTILSPSATAEYTLPPRDPLNQDVTTSNAFGSGSGARIHLQGSFSQNWPWETMHWQEDLWHVIEWQDPQGEWHEVAGWQGHFDTVYEGETNIIGHKELWADDTHLGSGPFRWRVTDMKNGRHLNSSANFYLPAEAGHIVTIWVDLAP